MAGKSDAEALAGHLDAINRRVAQVGPTSNADARMRAIMADHEAACSALRRAEAETEIDGEDQTFSVEVR